MSFERLAEQTEVQLKRSMEDDRSWGGPARLASTASGDVHLRPTRLRTSLTPGALIPGSSSPCCSHRRVVALLHDDALPSPLASSSLYSPESEPFSCTRAVLTASSP